MVLHKNTWIERTKMLRIKPLEKRHLQMNEHQIFIAKLTVLTEVVMNLFSKAYKSLKAYMIEHQPQSPPESIWWQHK